MLLLWRRVFVRLRTTTMAMLRFTKVGPQSHMCDLSESILSLFRSFWFSQSRHCSMIVSLSIVVACNPAEAGNQLCMCMQPDGCGICEILDANKSPLCWAQSCLHSRSESAHCATPNVYINSVKYARINYQPPPPPQLRRVPPCIPGITSRAV